MMYVVDYRKAVMVHYEDGTFIIEDILSGTTTEMSESHFYGDGFKYSCDFEQAFRMTFDGNRDCIYTTEANQQIVRLIDANREGIHSPYLLA